MFKSSAFEPGFPDMSEDDWKAWEQSHKEKALQWEREKAEFRRQQQREWDEEDREWRERERKLHQRTRREMGLSGSAKMHVTAINPFRVMKIAERLSDEQNSLNGLKNEKARKEVMHVLHRNAPKGILHDEDWRFVNVIWKALNSAAFDWTLVDSFYDKDSSGMPARKTWKFEVYFTNDKGRKTVIYGVVIASAAGQIDNPMGAYDIITYAN